MARLSADRLKPHFSVRHRPFYLACGIGLVAFLLSFWLLRASAVGVGGNGLFIAYLSMVFFKLKRLTPDFLTKHAREEDAPVGGIFLVAFSVVVVCTVSMFLSLNGSGPTNLLDVGLSVVSVLLGWFTIHTMAALHYAYEYYEAPPEPPKKGEPDVTGGLVFPGEDEPDGSAFLYFAYVMGTAVATSDVKVTSNAMRRRVMIHGTFAFFFNTVILAATVNVVLSLGGS